MGEKSVPTIAVRGRHFPAIEMVVFDKDGTLADSRHYLMKVAYARVQAMLPYAPNQAEYLLAVFGCATGVLNPEGLMAVGTRTENEIAAAASITSTGQSWQQALQLTQAAFEQADQQHPEKAIHTPPYPGTAAMLERLAKAGLKLAVLSSDRSKQVIDFVKTYGLDPHLDRCQGTDSVELAKPNPIQLHQLCAELGCASHQVVVVGDTLMDQALAKQAGAAAFIAVSSAWGAAVLPEADAVLQSWDDLQVLP